MNKAIDQVRAAEVKQLRQDGYEPILKWCRWLLLKRRENLTDKAYWAEEARQSTIRNVIDRMLMFEMGKDFRKAVPPAKPRDYILPVRKGAKPTGKKASPKGPTTRPADKAGKAEAPKQ